MSRALLGLALVLTTVAGLAHGTDITVLDTSGQTMDVRNVQATIYDPPRAYLPVTTETWSYDIPFSLIKEAMRDPGVKKNNSYEPTPFVISLTTGTQIKGKVNTILTGESEFGKAEVKHDQVKSMTFKKAPDEAEFKPAEEGPSATVDDEAG